jgi:hypothetical protein
MSIGLGFFLTLGTHNFLKYNIVKKYSGFRTLKKQQKNYRVRRYLEQSKIISKTHNT